MFQKLRNRLKATYLALTSRAFYIISSDGASFHLPERIDVLEALQDEIEGMDRYLEDTIMELTLAERDSES